MCRGEDLSSLHANFSSVPDLWTFGGGAAGGLPPEHHHWGPPYAVAEALEDQGALPNPARSASFRASFTCWKVSSDVGGRGALRESGQRSQRPKPGGLRPPALVGSVDRWPLVSLYLYRFLEGAVLRVPPSVGVPWGGTLRPRATCGSPVPALCG